MQPLSNSNRSVRPVTPVQPIAEKPRELGSLTQADIETIEGLEQLELSLSAVDRNAFLETPLPTLYALEEKQMDDAMRRRVQHIIEMRLYRKPREQFATLFAQPKEQGIGEYIDVHG